MTLSSILFSTDYLPNIGGVASHVHELARGLSAAGHWVRVVTEWRGTWREPRTWCSRFVTRDGVTAVELARTPLQSEPGLGARWRRTLRPVINEAIVHGSDLVLHTHWGTPWFCRLDCTRVFTNHTSMFLQDLEGGDAEKWRIRCQQYDWIIAPSRELAEKTVEVGFDADRVSYIPNGVDVGKFKPDPTVRCETRDSLGIPQEAVVVLCARRCVPKNGVIDFAHALRFLSRQLNAGEQENLVVVVAGNNDIPNNSYEREVLGEFRQSSLGSRARLLGPVPNSQMSRLYVMADMSVLPSLKEATSISGLESMASGTPVIGTRVGGIPDLVKDEVDGLLVDHGDPRGLADSLKKLIRNRTLREEYAAKARQKAGDEFSWEQITRRTIEVYEQAGEIATRRRRKTY